MVRLTRINRREVVLNAELFVSLESAPETVVTLTTGEKVMVLESPDEVIERVVAYRRRVVAPRLEERA